MSASEHPQVDEIQRALGVLTETGQTVELRAVGVTTRAGEKPHIVSEVFTDTQALANKAIAVNPYAKGVYITLNPLRAEVEGSASDTDVERRRWLPIDVDPTRPAGTSSSDEEHEAALRLAQDIKNSLGWPEPVEGDSGNGAHLLYAIDLPNDDESRELVQRVLKALDYTFSDELQQIDTGNYNAARIWKLYGTVARKGTHTPERPHRMARLLKVPEHVQVVTREQLEALAAMLPEQERATGGKSLNLTAWLEKYSITVERVKTRPDMTVYVLRECPWSEEHSDGAGGAAVIQFSNGAVDFKCHHSHCEHRTWQDFRGYFEPQAEKPALPHRYRIVEGRLVKVDYEKAGDGGLREVERTIALAPIAVETRLVNVDNGEEALRVTWQRDGVKSLVVDRGTLMNARDIVELAKVGFPVNSANAKDIVEFITAFEAAWFDRMRVERVSSHMGWQGRDGEHGFLWGRELLAPPGTVPVTFRGASGGDEQLADGYHASGSLAGWVEGIRVIKDYPLAQVQLYTAFISPLLPILRCDNFVVDLANRTSTGKSTVMRVAASAVGNPDEVIHTWKTTRVGYERLASATTGLPLFMDDTKTARKPEFVGEILYDHAAGRGSSRGNVDGLQFTRTWRSVLLSTGEGSAVEFTQDGGTRGRVLSLKGMPFGSDRAREVVDALNTATAQHYGHAFPLFIRFILAHKAEWTTWRDEYHREATRYANLGGSAVAGRLAKYFAAVTLTARLVHRAFTEAGQPLPWTPQLDGLWAGIAAETGSAPPDIRALQDVYSWACQHRSKFWSSARSETASAFGPFEPNEGWYGRWDGGEQWTTISFQPLQLKKFLTEQGYRPDEIVGAWRDRGWVELDSRGSLKTQRIGSTTPRVVTVKRTTLDEVGVFESVDEAAA